MKTFSVAEALENLDAVLKAAQKERVVVTRDGKPSVVLLGVESYDEEQLELAASPEFWRVIEERRRDTTGLSLADFKARLEAREAREGAMKTNRNGGKPLAPGRTAGTPRRPKKDGGKLKR